jgi:acyl carrier protein
MTAGAVLTGEEVLDVVRRAVATVLELDPAGVTAATRLAEDLGADSLAIVEIVEIVEEELAVRSSREVHLDDEVLDDLRTVGDAADHALAQL